MTEKKHKKITANTETQRELFSFKRSFMKSFFLSSLTACKFKRGSARPVLLQHAERDKFRCELD